MAGSPAMTQPQRAKLAKPTPHAIRGDKSIDKIRNMSYPFLIARPRLALAGGPAEEKAGGWMLEAYVVQPQRRVRREREIF
jgi:hypothetical protein